LFIVAPHNFIIRIFHPEPPEKYSGVSEILAINNSGNTFHGLIYKSRCAKPIGTMILLHGVRHTKFSLLELKDYVVSQGYNAVLFDLRGHDDNKAAYCTYGYYEKYDVKILVDSLIKRGYGANLGIWGESLGGVVALQSLSNDERIKYGIIESGFADFDEMIHSHILRIFGFDIPLISNFIIQRAGEIADFEPEKVKPSASCKHIEQEVIFVHGKQDKIVNYKHCLQNFKSTESRKKHLLLVDSASHSDILQKGGKKLTSKVFRLLTGNN
jgi:dipeptidyl aminopeptidase/acylaminoacyl peptidase